MKQTRNIYKIKLINKILLLTALAVIDVLFFSKLILAAKKIQKPLSDQEWKTALGSKASEKYHVVAGDTLSSISKKLFGNSKYWPKIWELNSTRILNPHKLQPGIWLAFSNDTNESVSGISTGNPDNNDSFTSGPRSTDWQNLPHQSWENYQVVTPPEIDPLGFDTRDKIIFHGPTGFELPAIPASDKIQFLGKIKGSQSNGEYLSTADLVYISNQLDSDDDKKTPPPNIEIGSIYAITQEPTVFKSDYSKRTGYSYLIKGRVKVIDVKDSLFVGRIVSANEVILRGDALIPIPPKIPILNPIPGPSNLEALMFVDHEFSTFTTAQHKEVFIDRGSNDGIQPGMIFRLYQHNDPSNDKKITDSNMIVQADLQVTQVSALYSSALVIRSITPIAEKSHVFLLTDVSDLMTTIDNNHTRPNPQTSPIHNSDIDDLDKLDTNDGLGKNEQRELKQLEQWKNNPTPLPSPQSSAAPPTIPSIPLPATSGQPEPDLTSVPTQNTPGSMEIDLPNPSQLENNIPPPPPPPPPSSDSTSNFSAPPNPLEPIVAPNDPSTAPQAPNSNGTTGPNSSTPDGATDSSNIPPPPPGPSED